MVKGYQQRKFTAENAKNTEISPYFLRSLCALCGKIIATIL